jgi:hypothetical protein
MDAVRLSEIVIWNTPDSAGIIVSLMGSGRSDLANLENEWPGEAPAQGASLYWPSGER